MFLAKLNPATGILVASVFALSACTAADPGATTGATTAAAPEVTDVDLRMTIWSSNEGHLALFNGIAEDYMAENPNIRSITFDPLPFDGYTSTLTTQIAGGDAPDLAWIFETNAPDFVQTGALVDLSETLRATAGYDFDDLSPAATELWIHDGGLQAYPFSTSPFVMFANDDLLAEAGYPTALELQSSGDWNWEKIAEVGAAVNQATGEAGFIIRDFEYSIWKNLSTVWNGWGASPWSADGTTCGFESSEMIDAFTFMRDAAMKTGAMPGPGTTADFFAGQAAFTVTQISRAGLLKEDGFEWNVLPLPSGPAGDYSVVGQAGIGVIARGDNPEIAADFLAYFTNVENSERLAQFFPPPRESLLNASTLSSSNPVISEAQLSDVVVPAITNGEVQPAIRNSARVEQAIRSALDPMWTVDSDVKSVLGSVCEALNPLLGE